MADEILLQAIAEGFKGVDERFNKVDERLDRVTQKLVEHDERFNEMVTKEEFHKFANQTNTTLDAISAKLNTLDQERVFTYHAVQRLENEINRIKAQLKLA